MSLARGTNQKADYNTTYSFPLPSQARHPYGGQHSFEDDVGEGGLQAQGDPPTGELLADRVVLTSDGHRADGVDRALNLHWDATSELGPGRSSRWRASRAGPLSAQSGQVDAGEPGGQRF